MEKRSALSKVDRDLNVVSDEMKDIQLTAETTKGDEKSKISELPRSLPETCTFLHMNDDCILHILSMLPLSDSITLRLTHPRFVPLFRIAYKNLNYEFLVNPVALSKYPLATSLDRYGAMGEITSALRFDQVDESVVTTLLPSFPNILNLALNVRRLKDFKAISTFPIPEGLKLDVKNMEKSYLNALLTRFAPRLKRLNCLESSNADFGMLPNLTVLQMNCVELGKNSHFWKTNETLEALAIHNPIGAEDLEEIFYDFNVVWTNLRDIANMKSLRVLRWNITGWQCLPDAIIPQFSFVTELHLSFNNQFIFDVIGNVGSQLKKLIILHTTTGADYVFLHVLIPVIVQIFPLLETMSLFTKSVFREEYVTPLLSLKNMRDCVITCDLSPAFTLEMVKALPKLRSLKTFRVQKVSPELISYLKEENRSVKIDGVDYPAKD